MLGAHAYCEKNEIKVDPQNRNGLCPAKLAETVNNIGIKSQLPCTFMGHSVYNSRTEMAPLVSISVHYVFSEQDNVAVSAKNTTIRST